MVRRATFTPWTTKVGRPSAETFIRPLGGFHGGLPPQDLPEAFTPSSRNFVPAPASGFITPRSGLSRYGPHDFGGPVLGAAEVFDIEGSSCGFAPSARSFSFLHPSNQAWSELSYVPSGLTHFEGAPSGTTSDYFRTTSIYDQNIEAFLAVTSNNTDSFKAFVVDESTGTFSDFTFPDSLASTFASKDIVSVNDRLVMFNTLDAAGARFPTRVLWSARGNPRSFFINDGAGFEDVMDMRGAGQAAIRFRDFLLLFTDYEIWRGTPTFDAFAFRFDRVVDSIGCPFPKTIVTTPNGVVFVGRDREVYVTDGASVAPLGPVDGEGPSRVQGKLSEDAINLARAWATYNSTTHAYELYFVTGESSDGFPDEGLTYFLEERTWWPMKFSFGLSSGVDLTDPATLVTWDELSGSWDSYAAAWDDYNVSQGNRRVNVFDSRGTTLRFNSAQTSDAGTPIDARWRSKGFKNGARRVHLAELWLDYAAASASSASLYVGESRTQNEDRAVKELSLVTSSRPIFVPLWATSQAPDFELRIADGGRPKIASFSATLRDAGKF